MEEICELYSRHGYEWWPEAERIEKHAVRRLLEKHYDNAEFSNPEMSCNVPNELLPIKYVDALVVDPISIDGRSLVDSVKFALSEAQLDWCPRVLLRNALSDRRTLYQELIDLLSVDGSWSFYDIPFTTLPDTVSNVMRSWVDEIERIEYQLIRYCTYTLSDTIMYSRKK